MAGIDLRRWFDAFRQGGQTKSESPLRPAPVTATKRWPVYDQVEFLPNDVGVRPGAIGFILEDYGDAYEVEVNAPDSTSIWVGSVRDEFLVHRVF